MFQSRFHTRLHHLKHHIYVTGLHYTLPLGNYPLQESRFSKCDVCSAIKEGRERTLNQTVRMWLGEILEKHIKLEKFVHSYCMCAYVNLCTYNRDEREKYAKHRQKSIKNPGKYMSLIIDGMDQAKTDIPHIISNPKAMAGSVTLETHITGVRIHGWGTTMFINCGEFHHDSNLTIDILLRVFDKFKVYTQFKIKCERTVIHLYLQEKLPPVLYVQMDNTCRDNKNKFVLTFVALLVEAGIFRKVSV